MSTDHEKPVTPADDMSMKTRQLLADLEALDIDALVAAGRLVRVGRDWYEVPGNIHELPTGVGHLVTETGLTRTRRPKIKLGSRDRRIKALQALCSKLRD